MPYKVWRSVADYQNYGDEPEAVDILYPSTGLEFGISESDFQHMRSREEIRSMFEKIGQSFKAGKFNTLYNKALQICDSKDDRVSVRSFLDAIQIYKDLD